MGRNTNSTNGPGHPDGEPDDVARAERWAELATAVRFFTRIPVPGDHGADDTALANGIWAAPLVGAGVGAIGAVVAWLALWLGLPGLVSGILALAAMAIATGALHEDGLADTADGLGGRDAARRLEIMRDSHIGAYGTLALVFVVAAKIGGLGGLAFSSPGQGAALIAAGALSRAMLAVVPHLAEPARDDGLGAGFGQAPPAMVVVAVLLGAVVTGLVLAPAGIGYVVVAMIVAFVSALVVTALARQAFGGYTGDVLGAVQQIVEVAVILTVSSFVFGAV